MSRDREYCEFDAIGQGLSGDLRNLQVPTGCTVLNLHCNNLTCLTDIPLPETLVELVLSSNSLSTLNFTKLAYLPRLTSLDISGNVVDSLASAPFLPGLRTLSVAYNNLYTLAGVAENFPDVDALDARGNFLGDPTSLGDLEAMDALKHLQLGGGAQPNLVCVNHVASIAGLFDKCARLETIDGKCRDEWFEESKNLMRGEHDQTNEHLTASKTGAILLIDSISVDCSTQSNDEQDSAQRANMPLPVLATPKLDQLMSKYRDRRASAVTLIQANGGDLSVDYSAFYSEEKSIQQDSLDADGNLDILNVYVPGDIDSTESSPRKDVDGVEEYILAEVAIDSVQRSPLPRSFPVSIHGNPWEARAEPAIEDASFSEAATAPVVSKALVADMRALLGALREKPEELSTGGGKADSGMDAHVEGKSAGKEGDWEENLAIALRESEEKGKLIKLAQARVLVSMFCMFSEKYTRPSTLEYVWLRWKYFVKSRVAATVDDSMQEVSRAMRRTVLANEALEAEQLKVKALELRITKSVQESTEISLLASAVKHDAEAKAVQVEQDLARTREESDNQRKLREAAQSKLLKSELKCQELESAIKLQTKLSLDDKKCVEEGLSREAQLQERMREHKSKSKDQDLSIGSLHADLVKITKENQTLKQEYFIATQNWEGLLKGHTDILELERSRSKDITKSEADIRVRYSKLERRFQQLELAFEKSLSCNEELTAALATEKHINDQSRVTVLELGSGIKKLQGALRRSSSYKSSAHQLKDALQQAQSENEALIIRLNATQDQKEEKALLRQQNCAEFSVNQTAETTLAGEDDTLIHDATTGDLRRRIDELEADLDSKNDHISRTEELSELLAQKEDELLHTIQVKDAMLTDQAAAITGLKERVASSEEETLNAENVIVAMEEQLEYAKSEISNLERVANLQKRAEEHMRKMLNDYHVDVRRQLENDEDL